MRQYASFLNIGVISASLRSSGKTPFGSCVLFLVYGTILQQCSSLLKNSASIEDRKNLASDCWRIVPATVKESCQWLLKNRGSHCWIIVPVTVEELCQWRLKNRGSHCWTSVPVTVQKSGWRLLNNLASDCCTSFWTVEKSCQWLVWNYNSNCWRIVPALLKNFASDCWTNCASDCSWIVPTTIEQSWQLFSPFNLLWQTTSQFFV